MAVTSECIHHIKECTLDDICVFMYIICRSYAHISMYMQACEIGRWQYKEKQILWCSCDSEREGSRNPLQLFIVSYSKETKDRADSLVCAVEAYARSDGLSPDELIVVMDVACNVTSKRKIQQPSTLSRLAYALFGRGRVMGRAYHTYTHFLTLMYIQLNELSFSALYRSHITLSHSHTLTHTHTHTLSLSLSVTHTHTLLSL